MKKALVAISVVVILVVVALYNLGWVYAFLGIERGEVMILAQYPTDEEFLEMQELELERLATLQVQDEVSQGKLQVIHIHGDFPMYDSIGDLSSAATDIVRAKILDERVENINIWMPRLDEYGNPIGFESYDPDEFPFLFEAYYIFTVYRLYVLDVFKGDAVPGDIMEVKLIGGQYGNVVLVNDDYVPLIIGDDLVFFLETYDMENMPASLLNPVQSAYRVASAHENVLTAGIQAFEEGNFTTDTDETIVLESVNNDNTLELTIEFLLQLLESNR